MKKYSTCNFGNNLHPDDKKALKEFIAYRKTRAIKKELPFCLRCGIDKKKGFYEGGCSSWGRYYPRHMWNTKKNIDKATVGTEKLRSE